jgi:clan AA aspartic protease (TIGR02281 family)
MKAQAALRILLGAGLLGVLSWAPDPAAAQLYRWTDESGRIHVTQDLSQVPAAKREEALAAARGPSRLQIYETPQPASAPGPGGAGGALSIPFERRGNAMLVQVRLNDRVTAPFLVDTGATDVAIPASVAQAAGIVIGPETPHASYQTANGVVRKPVVVVESIAVGAARVERVRASVSHGMDVGLLGGSFFSHFTFQVDPAAQILTLLVNDRVRAGLSERQWRERFRTARGRLAALEHHLASQHFARESRVEELEERRAALAAELASLEWEANAAEVPQGWRE